MYIVTGGAGFIGSAFVWRLNQAGIEDILIVDDLDESEKWKNLVNLRFEDYLDKDQFFKFIVERGDEDPFDADAIVHLGADSSTTQVHSGYLMENNYRYTQMVCRFAVNHQVRLVNASSAATYGDGSRGFSDDPEGLHRLKPLNMYGYSKHLLDLWARKGGILDRFASLKFFNVFGPNEYHKGDMMSVVCKAHAQIGETGSMRLFKSHDPRYEDGGQKRDFVYVKDCVDVMMWLLENPRVNGVLNVGTGKARSFRDLALAVFEAMGREADIEYIDMPEAIRGKYQYFTEADTDRLKDAGCPVRFTSLEDAVKDYVAGYLSTDDPYLGNGAD